MRRLTFEPLTHDRWNDLEKLFGARGACGGCWCMWWRLKRSEFVPQKGAKNKEAFKTIVTSGTVPGILAYAEGEPVGWCAVQPREAYPVLERSRTLKPIDDQRVWSISCIFISKPLRRQGLSTKLVKAAIQHVRLRGGRIVEAYPSDPTSRALPDAFVWTGLIGTFLKAGFKECLRRSKGRPIMRYTIRR